jgi:hypothetical protein
VGKPKPFIAWFSITTLVKMREFISVLLN